MDTQRNEDQLALICHLNDRGPLTMADILPVGPWTQAHFLDLLFHLPAGYAVRLAGGHYHLIDPNP